MEGHKMNATVNNMKGGSNWFQRSKKNGLKDRVALPHKYSFTNPLLCERNVPTGTAATEE